MARFMSRWWPVGSPHPFAEISGVVGRGVLLSGGVWRRACGRTRRAAAQAAKEPCPRCRRPGLLRTGTRLVWFVFQGQTTKDPPRACRVCGQLRRRSGLGMCSRCWQADPDQRLVRGENLIDRLEEPPPWLGEFVAYLAARHSPSRAASMISNLMGALRFCFCQSAVRAAGAVNTAGAWPTRRGR